MWYHIVNMAHAGGRPTKYDPSFVSKVDEYLAIATKENMHLPKIVSFAIFLGVNKTTLYEWANNYPEFSNSLSRILEAQEERLQDDGIYGGKEVNSTIVKLLLQNNHGMREKQDVTTDGEKMEGLVIIKDGNTSI